MSQAAPPHCPGNGWNCHSMAWCKYQWTAEPSAAEAWVQRPCSPGGDREASLGSPLWYSVIPPQHAMPEALEWQGPREVSPDPCCPGTGELLYSLVSCIYSTCIKLNRLFATFCLPVAGCHQNTEAHQTISLLSSHKSGEWWWHTSNLIRRKQNWYMFSPNEIKKLFLVGVDSAIGDRLWQKGSISWFEEDIVWHKETAHFQKYLRN